MSGYNRVVLMGNLTRDPQLRHIPDGTAVTDIRLATSEVSKSPSGETVERVCYVDVVAWGRQAEACAEYLGKGRPVLVEGRLRFEEWETDKGEKRNKLRVRADRVQFLGGAHTGSKENDAAEPVAAVAGSKEEEMPF